MLLCVKLQLFERCQHVYKRIGVPGTRGSHTGNQNNGRVVPIMIWPRNRVAKILETLMMVVVDDGLDYCQRKQTSFIPSSSCPQ
jgi:hypothetical protein